MIDEVIERLARDRLVVVHGASGSGKSSLVRAGVMPKLARQHCVMARHGSLARCGPRAVRCGISRPNSQSWRGAPTISPVSRRFMAFSTAARRRSRRSRARLRGFGQELVRAGRPVRGAFPLREGDEPRGGGAVRRADRPHGDDAGRRALEGCGRGACRRHDALGIPWRMRALRRARRDHQSNAISRAAHGRRRAHARRAASRRKCTTALSTRRWPRA